MGQESLRLATRSGGVPRVLVVSENESVPSDRRVWAISTALVRGGCEVVVVCPQGDASERAQGERAPFELRDGVEIHRFPLRFAAGGPLGYLGEYCAALWRVWRTVRQLSRERPFDVVHACNPPDFMLFAAWPARRDARLIFDHHDLTPELFQTRFGGRHRLLHKLTLLLERLSFAAADVVLATNESYAQIAQTRGHKPARDVFVVRNGPDLQHFRATRPDPVLKRGKPLLISYVGVMAPQDGVDHALRALALVRDRRSDWHAVLAGEGEARAYLQRLADELGIGGAVEFPGWLDDDQISRLLSTSDVCLAPEPLTPLNDVSTMVKIAEYLAISRPVVAYDLRESRRAAGDAAVYAAPNEVDSFAHRITELLDDPDRRAVMGRIGRERVEQSLSWERSEMALIDAYRQALQTANGSAQVPLATPQEDKTFWESAAETTWGRYLTEAERRILLRALDLAPRDGDAMEVGCEGGRWSRYLVERRGSAICTDIDPKVLKLCGERLPQARCVLSRPGCERLPAGDGELALLLVYEVVQVTDASWFPTEAARVLRPGGILAFSHYNSASLRAGTYRAAALMGRSRSKNLYYRGPSYTSLRRSMARAGFEIVQEDGIAWAPFTRKSNSRLIPAAVRIERACGLRRLPSFSPWVLTIARRA